MNSQSLGEEIANAVTHGVAVLLAIAGSIYMIIVASLTRDTYKIVSVCIYGASLILLYLSSTLYHSLPGKRCKKVFKIIDHSAIFVLIAGSYTPFTLIVLREAFGWYILISVWIIALLGICFKIIFIGKLKKLSTYLYILMGWIIIFDITGIYNGVDTITFLLLAGGGVFYTLGCIFYAKDNWKFNHSIWHIFVVIGSILQYFSIMRLI